MKTIGFYSYKGGTGKSLLAANLAVCLSRLRKNCIIVDCDVEGPSIHHKFAEDAAYAPGRGGFLELLSSCIEPGSWHKRSLDDVSPKGPADVHKYVYRLSNPHDESRERFDEPHGCIHMLPAGDTSKPAYWDIVWSPLWHELFTLFNAFATGQISTEAYKAHLGFLLQIKQKLQNLDPAPDYMLIDFASGASEMSTTLINAWVDTLVYGLAFNDENIAYLKKTYKKIQRAGQERRKIGLSQDEMDIHVLLTRVPTSFDYRDRGLERALQESHYTNEMLVIHSDRDLEMLEQIRCGHQTTPQNRRLTHDYVDIFERLINPDDIPKDGLAATLHLPSYFEEKERVFSHETQRGTLINPNDASRNVSLKVATFQNLLLGFQRGLAQLMNGAPEGEPDCHHNGSHRTHEWFEEMLASAGRECGDAFGKALMSDLGADKVGIHRRIEMWTEFDSDVGFGRFVFDDDDYEEIGRKGSRHVKCDIYLVESFLTPANDTNVKLASNHPLCALMTGYIQGVLNQLIDGEIEVEHSHCPATELPERLIEELGELCEQARSDSCHFHVRTRDTLDVNLQKERDTAVTGKPK